MSAPTQNIYPVLSAVGLQNPARTLPDAETLLTSGIFAGLNDPVLSSALDLELATVHLRQNLKRKRVPVPTIGGERLTEEYLRGLSKSDCLYRFRCVICRSRKHHLTTTQDDCAPDCGRCCRSKT
ncbi:hypothetical protein CYLTODRAFT_427826 [Cylindrobasidium torrendii FP15055 ss-10]|uniref:Uncharacterized protein n=1 Tax=Cylindrobasidium torrendii FP15055 ss-10 TaxID=1314674 RepID=A0A0D7AR83_9AGAR|nr:hypothetical protein CYLTODRAFT_427826 [Cylindrobasidium torrendii FP15055 ss-10]